MTFKRNKNSVKCFKLCNDLISVYLNTLRVNQLFFNVLFNCYLTSYTFVMAGIGSVKKYLEKIYCA